MTWGAVLHKNKPRIHTHSIMNNRNSMRAVAFLSNCTPILLPEDARSFYDAVKRSPEHSHHGACSDGTLERPAPRVSLKVSAFWSRLRIRYSCISSHAMF